MTAWDWCKLWGYNISVLVFQVAWHLYLTGNGRFAKKIAHFYFYRDLASILNVIVLRR
ncbi:MAG: hypothetical protein JWN25_2443 [Verrucomicrobiales bacterium]|nr:hypothetical protein [Verrucomicrobiales bacterium]